MGIFSPFINFVASRWRKIILAARREADGEGASAPSGGAEPSMSPVVVKVQASAEKQFANQPPDQIVQPCPAANHDATAASKPSQSDSNTKTPSEWGDLSESGYAYIYAREAQQGVSNKLHLPPGDGSGVTLGPGYDMGNRTESEVTSDLTAIGVDAEVAKKIAKGAGKKGNDARQFVADNSKLVTLDRTQEMALLRKVAPRYMDIVRNSITTPITQDQYAALVSLAYNTGKIEDPIKAYVNNGEHDRAAGSFWIYRRSEGVIIPGLVNRRRLDALLFSGSNEVQNIDFEGPSGTVKPSEARIKRESINDYGALIEH